MRLTATFLKKGITSLLLLIKFNSLSSCQVAVYELHGKVSDYCPTTTNLIFQVPGHLKSAGSRKGSRKDKRIARMEQNVSRII